MATWINGTAAESFGSYTDPLGGSDPGNEKQKNNAICLYEFFRPKGWTVNAVAAMCGNFQQESTINPGCLEFPSDPTRGGYGIAQWTPRTALFDILDYLYGSHTIWADGDRQQNCVYAEYRKCIGEIPASAPFYAAWNDRMNATYNLTFDQWAHSTQDPGYLARHFEWCYERPADVHPIRATLARAWYEYLSGHPVPPTPSPGGRRRKSPFWIYLRYRWR